MTEDPLISIVIPYYNNSGKYLKRCVDSILRQSYRELEILLVDDGAEDSSPEVAERIADKDARIRNIRIRHGGVSVARNTGLAHARGEFIMFMDSDDWLADGILERMLRRMQATGVDLVTCDLARAVSPESEPKPVDDQEELCSRNEFLRLFFRIGSNVWVHYPVGKLYRKVLLPQPLFPPGIRVGEDVVGTYRAVRPLQKILRIRAVGYFYYTNPESVTSRFSDRDFDLIDVWNLVVHDTEGIEPDIGYAVLNRERVYFTLLFRMITELSRKERQQYQTQENQLLQELRACEKNLLHSEIVLSRKALIILLCHCYPAASCLGAFSVRLRRSRGKQTGFFRRKLS